MSDIEVQANTGEEVPAASQDAEQESANESPDTSQPTTEETVDLTRALDEEGLFDEERFGTVEQELVERERWSDLATLYSLGAERAPSPEIGRRMMLSAGFLLFEQLGDGRAAEPFLRRVLASDPENIDALDACRAICVDAGRFEEAADLLERSIEVAVDEEKPELLAELAAISYQHLHQVDRALAALRFAYEQDPSRLDVLEKAQQIFVSEERWADAKQVLDDEARAVLGDGNTPLELQDDKSAPVEPTETSDDGEIVMETPLEQADAKQIAEAYRHLGVGLLGHASQHTLAAECLERARSLGDKEALSKLDELAHIRQDWQAQAALYRDEGFEARDKRRAAQLYLSAAELHYEYGKDPIRTDEYLDRCLILSPGYQPALRFIEATHLEQGRHADLIKKLNGMAGSVKDSSIKVEILLRVAHLLENAEEPDAGEIISAYRRALAINPGHSEAIGNVTAILADVDKHTDRAQVLENQLGSVSDEYLKVETHLELGRVYAEMLGDSARSRAHFEAVLTHDHFHFLAASALRALYKDAREQPLLLGVLKVLVEHSPDLFSRLDMLHEMAEVAMDVSREEEFGIARQIFELDPGAVGIQEKIESLAGSLGRYQALADAYATAAAERSGDRAKELWTSAGRVYDARLPRPGDAIRSYRKALEIDPENQELNDALERLLRQQDDPEALVEVLQRQLDRNTDPDQELLLVAKIGGVLDRDLGDLKGAIEMFNRVLEKDQDNVSALTSLDDLYRREGDYGNHVAILARREAFSESAADRAEIRVRRARTLDERLSRHEEAAELYLDVLSQFPDHAEVIHALGHLLLENVMPVPIARALEPLFAARGHYDRQMEMLSVLVGNVTDLTEKKELAKRAAKIAEQKKSDLERAFDYTGVLLSCDPSDEEAREAFLRLARTTNNLDRAAKILSQILSREDLPPEAVAQIASSLGEIHDDHLDDKPAAITFYQRALQADAGNASVIAALERLLGAAERWSDLVTLLSERLTRAREAESPSTAAVVQLGLSLASIRDEHLRDADGAIEAYREILAVEPQEGTALAKLAEALERQERFRELVGVLDRMRDASSDPTLRAATDVKAGDVLRTRLKERSEALSRYQRALEEQPGVEGAVVGLEALLEDIEMRPQAGALLEPYYRESERWRDLVIALESQLGSLAEPDRRKELFFRIGKIEADQLEDATGAFDTFARAFRETLITAEERPELQRLALLANRPKDLAQLYEDALEQKTDADLCRELAQLYDGAAADQTLARNRWQQLNELVPGDKEALEALERLTAAGDNPSALAEVLVKRAEVASSTEERVAFLKRASAIFEEAAEDLDNAIECLERAKAEQPKDRTTWQELERLGRLTGRSEMVKEALEVQSRLVEEPLQRANVLVSLAECHLGLGEAERRGSGSSARPFQGLEEAIPAYEAALGVMPEHQPAREGLENLLETPVGAKAALALEPVYRSAGDWSHLVEAYEILAKDSSDSAERVERLVAIRSIYEERLGSLDRAFDAAARAYREAPDNVELLESLVRLGRLSGSVDELLGLLEDQAEALPYVSAERHEVRVRIAHYTGTLIRDRNRTIDAWKVVLEETPDSLVALEALEKLYEKGGEARELIEVLRQMAGLVEDPSDRTQKLRAAAGILEDKLGDRAGAARLYEQVLMLVPHDRHALDRLDALYSETRAYNELARILGEKIAGTEGQERAQHRLRMGQLRRGELEDPRGALADLSAILESGPEESGPAYDGAIEAIDDLMDQLKGSQPEIVAEAAALIEPHWASKGSPLKVVAAKEARIAAATEPTARRDLLVEIADLYEKNLDQPEMAFLALTRAYSEFPNDSDLATALERLATLAQTEEELAELYSDALPSIEDEELALRLARRTANIYDTVLERGEMAVPYYNRVLAIAPDDASALTSLERIHRRAGNMSDLVGVYRGMLRLAEEDKSQQKGLWQQIATIMEDDLEDTDGAFEAYRAIINLDPNDQQTLRKMEALCERSDRMDELAVVLNKEAEIAQNPDDKAQVFLKLATLAMNRLGDVGAAVTAFSSALASRSDDPGAIAGLASIAREGGEEGAMAAGALAPVYLENGAYEDYIGCLEAQAAASRSAAARKDLYVQIAETYEARIGRPERAFFYSQQALQEDLFDGGVRARVERLATEHGLVDELAAFYLDKVDAVTDHDLALSLRRRVAEIYDHDLKDVPQAIAEYNRVLDVAPGDTEALQALERLYRAAGSFGSLGEVYRRRIAQAEDDASRARLMREFGRLQAEELGDAPGAIATLRKLLEIEPDDVEALERLAKLCAAQGRASELADVLTRLIAAAEDGTDVQLAAKYGLGKLKAERLGDIGGADALFAEVLESEPTHEATRDYLQERFEDAVAEDNVPAAETTGEILADAMRAAEEWQELISVLRVRAGQAATGHDRVPLNREIAAIYRQQLKQPELSFTTLSQVYVDAPGVEEVRTELEELANELLMAEELVEVFESGLEHIHDLDLTLTILRRVAQLLTHQVGDRERAAGAWHRILSQLPMDAEALEVSDGLLLALGRWAGLVDVLEKRIELADDDDLRHELLVRLGAIWDERLDEREEALRCYRQARTLRSDDRETLTALSLLLDQEAHPEELYEVLEQLAGQTENERELLRLLPKMANLAAGPLLQGGEAIELWKRVQGIDPKSAAALKGLEELYESESRWEELAALLESEVQTARDEREVMRLQRRLGLIKGTRLGSVDEAVRSWSEILKRNPNDLEALSALRRIYHEAERWDELVATLRKLIPLQLDAEGVKSIRFDLAEVFLTHLLQPDEAIESAKRVLDVEPHTMAELMRLEEIFLSTAAYSEAVKVMNERVEIAEEGGAQVDILFEIARIYETELGRRAGAASAYERVLAIEPTSAKAYDALAAIYEANGDYRKLVELYNRRLDYTENAEDRKHLLFSIIDIQEKWLGQPELAFTAAVRAFGEEGADEKAQTIAERLAEETENWEILAEVYEEQVDQVSVARAIDLRRRLGEIYIQKLDDPERAEVQLEMVLSARPEGDEARGHLLRLLKSQERWTDVIMHLGDQVEITTDVEEKKELYRQMADIQEQKLNEIEGAISSTRRILDLDPDDPFALLELVRIFRQEEKWHPLLNALQRRLEQAKKEEDKQQIRFEMATVWEQGIEDLDHAIEGYNDVLAQDETHLPSLKSLERLYTMQERWIELVDVFEREVSLAANEDEAIKLLTRIAGIWEEQFRDLDGAANTLIRVLEINPEYLPTVKSLERIWRQTESWENLIEAYSRHIELVEGPQELVELYLSIGVVNLEELNLPEQAEAAFQAALVEDPSSREAIHALGQLHEQNGSWFNALEMLQREATLLGSSPEAVELYFRMGKINEEMLADNTAAKDAFIHALDIDPGYTQATRALRSIHEEEENWGEVINLQAQEAEYCAEPEERAALYQMAAETALDRFEDVDHAIRLYEKSIESFESHVPSLRALADLYFGDEDWERAEKLLERLVDRLDRHMEQTDLCRHNYRLAYISEKLGEDHQALKRYLASYELDSTYLPTLEGLAAALLRSERWEDAQRIYQTILISHKSQLTDAEVVDLHYQLGELAVRLDQLERAKKSFHKAVDLDPEHVPTLRAFADLFEKLGEWEDAYDQRERLIQQMDGDEKFGELVRQAKLCRDEIGEPYRAIDAFSEARRVRPDDVGVLRALVKLFDETSQAPRTVEALSDLGRLVQDPTEQRDIYLQLAKVYESQKDVQKAVASLNRALDIDPTHTQGFANIERILAKARSWPTLEENYHRMIKRMPKEQKRGRVMLWRALADLYNNAMKNPEGTKVAYEVVLKLDPKATDVALALAQLHDQRRETKPKAAELYHRLLSEVDDPAKPARALWNLYCDLGHLDRAFCALSALILMRAATKDDLKAYALLLKRTNPPKRSVADELWHTMVFHPNCRNSIAQICKILYRSAPDLFCRAQKELTLKRKKERVDLSARGRNAPAKLRYFNVWQKLANVMNVGDMDHYRRSGSTSPPRLYPGAVPVLFTGEQHEVFRNMPERQIAWAIARQMATARPELAPARALMPGEIAAAVEASIRFWYKNGSGVDLGLDVGLVEEWRKNLQRHLTETAIKVLKTPVTKCVERREMRKMWDFVEGVEHTASRIALLMAGDVASAERGLGESDQMADVSFRARVRSLMLFTLTEEHFQLREKLGIAIPIQN